MIQPPPDPSYLALSGQGTSQSAPALLLLALSGQGKIPSQEGFRLPLLRSRAPNVQVSTMPKPVYVCCFPLLPPIPSSCNTIVLLHAPQLARTQPNNPNSHQKGTPTGNQTARQQGTRRQQWRSCCRWGVRYWEGSVPMYIPPHQRPPTQPAHAALRTQSTQQGTQTHTQR